MTLRNDLTSVVQHLTSKGYVINSVFDVGANKGRWTAEYNQLLPNATFCMFEANPNQQAPKLATNHKWFNSVLSDPDTTEVKFYSISGTGDSYYKERTVVYDNCTPLILPTTTLDKLVAKHSLPPPQLMKMDTQGSELDILKGANNILSGVDILVTETAILPYNDGAPTFNDYLNTMSTLGFVPVGIEEIHIALNLLVQLDVVYLRREIKEQYYGDNKFLHL